MAAVGAFTGGAVRLPRAAAAPPASRQLRPSSTIQGGSGTGGFVIPGALFPTRTVVPSAKASLDSRGRGGQRVLIVPRAVSSRPLFAGLQRAAPSWRIGASSGRLSRRRGEFVKSRTAGAHGGAVQENISLTTC